MNEQEFAELAAGHALHALSPEDEREFEAALAAHPEWSSIADADIEAATTLADGVTDVAPPTFIRDALLARIGSMVPPAAESDADIGTAAVARGPEDTTTSSSSAEPPPTTDTVQTTERRTWLRGVFALAASLVLLIGLGFGAATINQQMSRSADVVALEQIESAPDAQAASGELADGGQVIAHWSESVGMVVIVSDGLPRLASDQDFEMWFVRDGEAISAGTFSAEGGRTTSLLDGDLRIGDTIAITVEARGGSATGAPTSDPIVAIATA